MVVMSTPAANVAISATRIILTVCEAKNLNLPYRRRGDGYQPSREYKWRLVKRCRFTQWNRLDERKRRCE
jgi:hypothetical protein